MFLRPFQEEHFTTVVVRPSTHLVYKLCALVKANSIRSGQTKGLDSFHGTFYDKVQGFL